MVAPMTIACPVCKTRVQLPGKNLPIGKTVQCSACRSRFRCELPASLPTEAKPSTILVACSACSTRLTVASTSVGKKVKCPKCEAISVCQPLPIKPKTNCVNGPAVEPPVNASQKKKTRPSKNETRLSRDAPTVKVPTKDLLFANEEPVDGNKTQASVTAEMGSTSTSGGTNGPWAKQTSRATKNLAAESTEPMSPILKWGGAVVVLFLVIAGGGYLYVVLSSPSVGNVTGKVYFNDRLLTSGQITFVPTNGIPIVCPIDAEGTYHARDVLHGRVIITVFQLNPNFKDQGTLRKLAKGKQDAIPDTPQKMHLLPEKYASATTSPLRFQMAATQATHDIHLIRE